MCHVEWLKHGFCVLLVWLHHVFFFYSLFTHVCMYHYMCLQWLWPCMALWIPKLEWSSTWSTSELLWGWACTMKNFWLVSLWYFALQWLNVFNTVCISVKACNKAPGGNVSNDLDAKQYQSHWSHNSKVCTVRYAVPGRIQGGWALFRMGIIRGFYGIPCCYLLFTSRRFSFSAFFLSPLVRTFLESWITNTSTRMLSFSNLREQSGW